VLLPAVFAFVLQGLSRFLNLALIPLLLLSLAGVLYYFQPQLMSHTLQRLPWLPHVTLGLACAIAWQFGRSRLVWLGLILFAAVGSINPQWVLGEYMLHGRISFIILIISWLMLSKDKGFSPRNLATSGLIIAFLAVTSAWLLPLATTHVIFQQWLLIPSTAWLFSLWPSLYQWYSATELLLIILSSVVALFSSVRRINNSQIALVISWLSYLIVLTHAIHDVNVLVVSVLAIIIAFAVIKDSFAMAFKDELTGIPSRRALMQKVDTLGRKYTLVMSDIDHFKKFNDSYGHDVGDEVLKLVASKLTKVTGGGKAFRFGGEEFVILFPGQTPEQVLPHIEAIRVIIADYDIALRTQPRPSKAPNTKPRLPAKDKIVKVTSSFGIAQRSKIHSTFQDVMKQADIALYSAKKAGRNCTKVAKQ
jgi:diguanylate cyclase (GGDEF)-like protein